MRNRRLLYVASGVAGLALGVGAVATSVQAAGPYDVDDYDLALLHIDGAGKAGADLLPEMVDLSNLAEGELDGETLRHVASTKDGTFLVALNASQELCLIVVTSGDDWAAASSCSGPEPFHDHGIGLRVQSPTTILEGYIVSDAAAASLADPRVDGLSRPAGGTNVLLVDATMPEAQRAQVRDALMAANISLLPGEP